jgi:hypothetical protein
MTTRSTTSRRLLRGWRAPVPFEPSAPTDLPPAQRGVGRFCAEDVAEHFCCEHELHGARAADVLELCFYVGIWLAAHDAAGRWDRLVVPALPRLAPPTELFTSGRAWPLLAEILGFLADLGALPRRYVRGCVRALRELVVEAVEPRVVH